MSEKIQNGWKWVKLGEVAEIIKGRKPETLIENPKENSLPYLTAEYFRYRLPSQFVKIEKERNLPVCEKDDIILIWDGSQAGQVFTGLKGILASTMVKIIPNLDKVDKAYLYFFLTTKFEYLNSQATGSAIPHVSKNAFLNLPIPLPPLPEQKAIAEVLSSIDDKIDLLHRQNKTLEKMAMTLFRQWFIEPTKDGLPEGWGEVELSKLGQIICGKTPSKNKPEYFGGKIPFIKIPDMHGNVFVFKTEDSLSEIGAKTQKNKTLPERSICVSCIATVGLVSMNALISQTNQQINSIIPYKEFYHYFLYLKMKSMKEELIAMASGGTATLNLNTTEFSKIKIEIPKEDYLHAFHEKIKYIFEKIFINTIQIQTLEKLRDTLLPKLMSGEVRVKMDIM